MERNLNTERKFYERGTSRKALLMGYEKFSFIFFTFLRQTKTWSDDNKAMCYYVYFSNHVNE